jgi:tetratricopeptide (TPR) repeat protein
MRAILLLAALCLAAPFAHAQSDQTSDPREFSEAARKAYAQSLKEARGLVAEKKYTEAIAILDKLTAERPREPQARFLKGLALADSGKPDAAIVLFQAVLGDFPELPEPHNNLAVLYAQKGEYALARDELEAAIAAAPDYAIAYENLGDLHARMAAVNYEKAIARDARNKSAPAKLKMVRDAIGPPPAPAAAAPAVVAPAAATPAVAAPAAATPTAAEPASTVTPAPATMPAPAATGAPAPGSAPAAAVPR